MKYVAFPLFGIELNINPVAFNILGKDIYWYGLIITSGILLALIYCCYLAKKQNLDYNIVVDVALYGIPISVIFARIYYVIFSWDSYKDNLLDVFKIWNGGIAIYGAIIGAVITAFVYCKAKKVNVLKVFDICIMGVIIGQIIGRWGNFINVEAYGTQTTLPFGMEIYENGKLITVHPTFLYESLWNLIGFLILIFLQKKKKFDGQIFYSYLVWYGIGRFFVEGLRVDSLYFGTFRVSQIVAIVTMLIGIILLLYNSIKTKKSD